MPASGTRGLAQAGDALEQLDRVDFEREMIVAAFWGELDFTGHDEKCWIEAIDIGRDEVTVDCRSNLFGGQALRTALVWPYEVRVIARSELPVRFRLKIIYEPKGTEPDRELDLATLKPDAWKQLAK